MARRGDEWWKGEKEEEEENIEGINEERGESKEIGKW